MTQVMKVSCLKVDDSFTYGGIHVELIRNGNFEDGIMYWTIETGSVTSEGCRSGQCLPLFVNGWAYQELSGRTHAGATLKIDHRFVLEPGREFDDTDVLLIWVHFRDPEDDMPPLMIEDLARFGDDWHSSEFAISPGEPIRLVIRNDSRATVYIDNVSLDSGPDIEPFMRPDSKRPPEDFNEPPLREDLERRLIGIEKQVNRLTKELAKQQSPDHSKEADKGMEEKSESAITPNDARIK